MHLIAGAALFRTPIQPSPQGLIRACCDDGLDDGSDDDPYIAFRSAGVGLGRWAPACRGSGWQQRDSRAAYTIGKLLASKATLDIFENDALSDLQVRSRLGEGRFGDVLLCRAQSGKHYAVKMALRPTAELLREARVLIALQHHEGFPKLVHHQLARGDQSELLVMEVLGASLQERWQALAATSNSCCVAPVARDLLRCLQRLHGDGYVHNDLKPENILFGAAGSAAESRLHLVDFGKTTRTEAPQLASAGGIGSYRWASCAAHGGQRTSPVDDLESAFYVLAFLVAGCLPWEQERRSQVADVKCDLLQAGG